MRISKYRPLTEYLWKSKQMTIQLTFDQIEQILGFELPQSAFQYSVWWMNTNQTTCVHWLKAGYIITQYNMEEEYVVFRKSEEAKYYLSKIPEKGKLKTESAGEKTHISIKVPKVAISCDELIAASQKYVDAIRQDDHARYLSWEHCYSYFQTHRKNPTEEEMDFMCLHLAWYLASWGMLRGGAFLLWKDYKVHLPIIQLLISAENEELNACDAEVLCQPTAVKKIMELSEQIVKIYWEATQKSGEGRKASDTLVTKILLGTLGCTPAYDRYFKSGLALSRVANQSYGEQSLLQLANYYVDHREKLERFRRKISEERVEYTPMKVIDMCFWQAGFDTDM